jgi:hypothetical protein
VLEEEAAGTVAARYRSALQASSLPSPTVNIPTPGTADAPINVNMMTPEPSGYGVSRKRLVEGGELRHTEQASIAQTVHNYRQSFERNMERPELQWMLVENSPLLYVDFRAILPIAGPMNITIMQRSVGWNLASSKVTPHPNLVSHVSSFCDDALVAVNDKQLVGLSLKETASELHAQPFPKKLVLRRFFSSLADAQKEKWLSVDMYILKPPPTAFVLAQGHAQHNARGTGTTAAYSSEPVEDNEDS